MRRIFGLTIALLAAGPAWAGCYNYLEDGAADAPRAEICFAGKCEQTAVEVTCGNATSGLVIYANGWRIDQFIEGEQDKTVISRDGKVVEQGLDSLVLDGRSYSELAR